MGKKIFEEILAKIFKIWSEWKIHWFKKFNKPKHKNYEKKIGIA